MTWSTFDDGILDHPKMLRAGEDAANLYIRGVIWCNKHLTDGFIPTEALCGFTRRPDAADLAARLASVGLWETTPDGWMVHDFLALNRTKEQVIARRADISKKRSEAGKAGARNRWNDSKMANASQTDGKAMTSTDGNSHAGATDLPRWQNGKPMALSSPKPKSEPPPTPPSPFAKPDATAEPASNPEPKPGEVGGEGVAQPNPEPNPQPPPTANSFAAKSVPPDAPPVVRCPTIERAPLPEGTPTLDVAACFSMLAKHCKRGLVVLLQCPALESLLLGEFGRNLAKQGVSAAHFAVLGAWCAEGKHGRTRVVPSFRTLSEPDTLADWLGRAQAWWAELTPSVRATTCPDGYPVLPQNGPIRATEGTGRPNPTETPSVGQKNASALGLPSPEKRAELVAIARSYRERAAARRTVALPPPSVTALEHVGEG